MKIAGKFICHIPARKGSKRVPAKNLRYIGDKPLIAYAIECAKQSGCFDEIYVNSDSETLCDLGRAFGVEGYLRDPRFASDEAKGDDFTADIMERLEPETLAMINPVCPLVTPDDVRSAVKAYQESDCDTLISCEKTQMQVFFEGRGVNIDENAALEPTQNNVPVYTLNWAVTVWNTKVFLETYRAMQKGYLGTNRLLFPIDPSHAVKISQEQDFKFAELLAMAGGMVASAGGAPRYWKASE